MTVTRDTVTMKEAAQLLGVSNAKLWRMVRDGVLLAYQNPLDRREKLIRRADIDHLRAEGRPPRRFVSDGVDTAPVDIPASRIKDWVRETRPDSA
jgi:excisionase family DNA binding protein